VAVAIGGCGKGVAEFQEARVQGKATKMLNQRKRITPLVLKSSGLLPSPLSQGHVDNLTMFSHFKPPDAPSGDESDWLNGISKSGLKSCGPGTFLLLPVSPVGKDEEAGIEFIMTVNSWILQLVSISPASKLSVVFKIIGLLIDDAEQKDLIVGQEYVGSFLNNCCVMVLHHNSTLAHSIDCLGELLTKKRKMAEARIDLLASPLPPSASASASGASAHDLSAPDSTSPFPLSSGPEPLSCHLRDAGPEPSSSPCPGGEAGTGIHPVPGGACNSFVASAAPALPAPATVVPADGEVLKSESLGKFFNDKDGVRRECGYSKPSSKELARVMGLCRLLNEDRRGFLEDWKFDMPRWSSSIRLAYHRCYENGGTSSVSTESFTNPDVKTPSLSSVSFYPQTYGFQVHRDKELLEQFLTGQWSADDWYEGVSLASFMELETPLKVVNTCTRPGRGQLATALRGVAKMMGVHFHGIFLDVFDDTCRWLEDARPSCTNYHDIYIRYCLESAMGAFFNDLWRLKRSAEHGERKMSNAVECYGLLKRYFSSLQIRFNCGNIPPQPHWDWYGAEGTAQSIRIDSVTQFSMFGFSVFIPPPSCKPKIVAFKDDERSIKHHHGMAKFERPEGPSARYQGVQNVEPCLWDMARQLGHKLKNGQVASCATAGCDKVLQHVPFDQVPYQVALDVLAKKPWGKGTKDMFVKLFAKNKHHFNK
jgi:hypothetical protein